MAVLRWLMLVAFLYAGCLVVASWRLCPIDVARNVHMRGGGLVLTNSTPRPGHSGVLPSIETYGKYYLVWVPGWLLLLPLLTGVIAVWAHHYAVARRRHYRRTHTLCVTCGYCLIGNTTGRCPECGALARSSAA